jgi:hypothetical protein
LAAQMLRQVASLAEIGELLGHKSPETTKIYAKVDLDGLRFGLGWLGVIQPFRANRASPQPRPISTNGRPSGRT